LAERAGVGVVVLDRDVPACSVTNDGRTVDLQVEEILRSGAADRTCIICYTGEHYGRRTAVHCSGSSDEVVADGRGGVAEIRCRAGVIQREIEEGRIAGQQLSSGAALESDCSSAGRERTAVGPIAAEREVEGACGKGRARDDVEIACDDGAALQRLR